MTFRTSLDMPAKHLRPACLDCRDSFVDVQRRRVLRIVRRKVFAEDLLYDRFHPDIIPYALCHITTQTVGLVWDFCQNFRSDFLIFQMAAAAILCATIVYCFKQLAEYRAVHLSKGAASNSSFV